MSNRTLALLACLGFAAGCASLPGPAATRAQFDSALATAASQVRRCYRSPRVSFRGRQIVTRLRVRFLPDGQLGGLPTVIWQDGITPDNALYAPRMAEAAIAAVLRCTPITLPQALYRDGPLEFDLTFSPHAAA